MYGYIYKTTCLVNNKIYIGQKKSSKFLETFYLGSGTMLKRAIKKYGRENFKVELLEMCDSRDILNEREIYWIDKYNSMDISIGYNITPGGWGGSSHHSIEAKNKISNYQKNSVVVNDGSISFRVLKSELQSYLDKGCKLGHVAGTCKHSEAFKEKVRLASTGKKAMHKGNVKTWVSPENVEKYLKDGYTFGYIDKKDKKVYKPKSIQGCGKYKYMFKNGVYLKVAEDKFNIYKQDGWIFKGPQKKKKRIPKRGYKLSKETCKKLSLSHMGHKQSAEAVEKQRLKMLGRKIVHKGLQLKAVYTKEIEAYLSAGWKLGRYTKKEKLEYKAELLKELDGYEDMTRDEKISKLIMNHSESTKEFLLNLLNN